MNRYIRHSIVLISAICLLQACMEEPDLQVNTNKGNLNALWEIIDNRYCYLDYKNINWDSIHTEYTLRVDTVSNKYGLFDLMGDMLTNLKDGHVNLYSEFDRSRYWNWYTDYPANFDVKIIFKEKYLGSTYRIGGPFRYKKIAENQVGYIYYGRCSHD